VDPATLRKRLVSVTALDEERHSRVEEWIPD